MLYKIIFQRCSLASVLMLLVSPYSYALTTVNNATQSVNSSIPVDDYLLINGATLIIQNGGETAGINSQGSRLIMNPTSISGAVELNFSSPSTIDGATISTGSAAAAFRLVQSDAVIRNSTITNFGLTGAGLTATRNIGSANGSLVTVSDSIITGTTAGAIMSGLSHLEFSNVLVQNTQAGLINAGVIMQGGTANFTNNTRIIGQGRGMYLDGDSDLFLDPTEVTLNGSSVTSIGGPGLFVAQQSIVNISVDNHSEVLAGDGTLLKVDLDSTVNLSVNNSQLTGDVDADASSTVKVQLHDNAYLKGQLKNVAELTVGKDSTWEQVGNNQIGDLIMDTGTVIVGVTGAPVYQTLTANTLTGTGNFKINTNFENGQSDLIVIKGAANGAHQLLVTATGNDPKVPAVNVVQTGGGGAVFSVPGGAVDLGTFQYEPVKVGDNWDLVRKTGAISTSTKAALAAADALPSVMRGQDAILRRRMGDINLANEQRSNAISAPIGAQNFVPTPKRSDTEPGLWARTFGSDYNIDAPRGLDYGLRQYGVSVGADSFIPDTNVLLGVTAGYDRSSLDLKRGSSGTIQSTNLGVYGLWANLTGRNDYLELVAKLHYLDSDSKVTMTDGAQTSGGYNTLGLSTSAEYGRYIKLSREWFVEPFVSTDLQSVKGKNYHLKNGLKVNVDNSNAWRTKAGATLGRNWALDNGLILQGYVRAAATYEFSGSNQVLINDNQFRSSQQGPGAEIGTGMNISLSDKLNFFADIQTSQGKHITMPWAYSTGFRWAF